MQTVLSYTKDNQHSLSSKWTKKGLTPAKTNWSTRLNDIFYFFQGYPGQIYAHMPLFSNVGLSALMNKLGYDQSELQHK
jgi:hypothetical protein